MITISEQHKQLNRRRHNEVLSYGQGGHKHAELVRLVAKKGKCESILDYGSGKGTLKHALGARVREYEPAYGVDERQDSDLVVAFNVLSCVEPQYLDAVIRDINDLCLKRFLADIGLEKDEHGMRQIVQPHQWWLNRLSEQFRIMKVYSKEQSLLVECVPC